MFPLPFFFFKALPVKEIKEKPEQQIRTKETDKVPSSTEPRQQPSALFARGTRKTVKSPQRSSSKIKENKHPFALYGWGERQTATGSQKTHNVCASAPVHEVSSRVPASLPSWGMAVGLCSCERVLCSLRCSGVMVGLGDARGGKGGPDPGI